MSKTLLLLFHPDLKKSKANWALARSALSVSGTEIIDMQARYPTGISLEADGEREAARLVEADRLVLQFPVQWYSTPPLLKAWQDAVLTRMFYLKYETEGRKLAGKSIMVAATAGNLADAYKPGGANMFTMNDLLAPLRATAHRCGLIWTKPFIVYRAEKISEKERSAAADLYAAVLKGWIEDGLQEVKP